MERKIVWQKWVNPLTGAGGPEDPDTSCLDAKESGWKDSVESDIQVLRELNQPDVYKPKLGQFIASPLGFIPFNEHGDPAVVYDFWIAHTNFDITHKVKRLASTVPGVESFDVFSRYRIRFGFGKVFKSSEVKMAIQKVLGCGSAKPATRSDPRTSTIERLKTQLASSAPAWAICELSDGQLTTFRGTEVQVRELVERQPTLKIITASWNGT